MTNCKECNEDLNSDDFRWVGKHAQYCRECVFEPVFQARAALQEVEAVALSKKNEGREVS